MLNIGLYYRYIGCQVLTVTVNGTKECASVP